MTSQNDIEICVPSQPRYLCVVRAAVGMAVEKFGFVHEVRHAIQLVVDEALSNIIRHGYDGREDGPIRISLREIPGGNENDQAEIQIIIEDEAKQIDPRQIQGRELDDIRPGGLGVHLIKEIMDEVTYVPRERIGMRLTMRKFIDKSDLVQQEGPSV